MRVDWKVYFVFILFTCLLSWVVNFLTKETMLESPKTRVRIVCISDTHNMHRNLVVPDGDILIHSGDMTDRGSVQELQDVNEWLGTLPHRYKIVVPGNMDIGLEQYPERRNIFTNAILLIDQSFHIQLNPNSENEKTIKMYGSPYTLEFVGAFQLYNFDQSREKWNSIPDDIDILVLHGPPLGILDVSSAGRRIGDENLLERIDQVRPKLVIFGHVHNSYGQRVLNGIHYVNAAQYSKFSGRNNIVPIVVDYEV